MTDIKIYVSQRIDLESVYLDNNIFKPIRCGACFDKNQYSPIPGDNSGDNVSQYRMNLGEITVQYWAWKNTKSDYCGLCHYRRYLSFSDTKFETDEKNQVIEQFLDTNSISKYNLDNTEKIKSDIEGYDIIVPEYADISRMYTPLGPRGTIYQHFCAYNNYLVNKEDIDNLITLVTELYPEIVPDMHEYLNGNRFLGYNCFVLKWDLFDQLCSMEYTILNEFKKRKLIDLSARTSLQQRTYGFICEWIFGIFIYHLEKKSQYKILKKQLVFFNNCSKVNRVPCNTSRIPIVYVTGHYYLPFMQASLYSALTNRNTSTQYEPIVLHNELSCDEIAATKNFFLQQFDTNVNFIDFKNYEIEGMHIEDPKKILAFLPWILPNFKKIIVLHCDTIVERDLTELYLTESNKAICAPIDPLRVAQCRQNDGMFKSLIKQLHLSPNHVFFSTNALVFNIDLARTKEYHLKTLEAYTKKYACGDILNSVYANNNQILGSVWNTPITFNPDILLLLGYLPK